MVDMVDFSQSNFSFSGRNSIKRIYYRYIVHMT